MKLKGIFAGTVLGIVIGGCGSDGGSHPGKAVAQGGAGDGATGAAGSAQGGTSGRASSGNGKAGSAPTGLAGTGDSPSAGGAGTGTGGKTNGSGSGGAPGGRFGTGGGTPQGDAGRAEPSAGTGGLPSSGGAASGAAGESGEAGAGGGAETGGGAGTGDAVSVSSAAAGDLVITEIMPEATTESDLGDWIEIYNMTARSFDLEGLELTTNAYDFKVDQAVIAPAHGYVLLSRFKGGGASGITSDLAMQLLFDASKDHVRLLVGGRVIDDLQYFDTWGVRTGTSLNMQGTPDPRNNAWCPSGNRYAYGQFASDEFGTPRAPNGNCMRFGSLLVPGDFVIDEIMPVPSHTRGEWFEVHNPGPDTVDLGYLHLTNNSSQDVVIADDLFVDPGGYVVLGQTTEIENGGIPVNYVYGSGLVLGDATGKIALSYRDQFEDTVLDQVTYDPSFSYGTGISMSLTPGADATANDVATSWCAAKSTDPSGSLATPGAPNDPCP